MPKPDNMTLYNKVKQQAETVYNKPSAYRSGFIVKEYKRQGGTYHDDSSPKNLKRWYLEDWQSIGGKYPTYRPTKRISKMTPLTVHEINPSNLKTQIALKQMIKGKSNLPPFKKL